MLVGIELALSQLTGTWQISQNRSEPDRLGAVAGVVSVSGRRAVAALVHKALSDI